MTSTEFEILAHDLRGRLRREGGRIVGSDSDADDVVQDTMLKLWTMREQLGEYRSVEALAVLICRRIALNRLRDSHRTQYVSLDDLSTHEPVADDSEEARSTGEYLDAVLASLPDTQQTLIRLRHIEGYDNATIAALLGSTEGAVRTALSRARKSVAKAFSINPDIL